MHRTHTTLRRCQTLNAGREPEGIGTKTPCICVEVCIQANAFHTPPQPNHRLTALITANAFTVATVAVAYVAIANTIIAAR